MARNQRLITAWRAIKREERRLTVSFSFLSPTHRIKDLAQRLCVGQERKEKEWAVSPKVW
jgi:hypothetical protein